MSDYLFARPSFWEGVARNADFFGVLNRYNNTSNPDIVAYQADSMALQEDLKKAVNNVFCNNGN